MNAEIALWCTAVALLAAIAVAVYWVRSAGRLRAKVAGLEEACAARDAAVAQLSALTLPSAAEVLSDSPLARPAYGVAPILDRTSFAANVDALAYRYTAGVRDLQRQV